ncbi:MAG: hypothetical protein Q7U47_15695 [Paludibacter sp.]|nr:hypothetical protein [Paludibacter sp.]
MKNITFLLGAGASYQSCPIWGEQGEKMIELAIKYLDSTKQDFENIPKNLTEKESILWDIGFFGLKAKKFGTIDTYARKLFLNESHTELSKLKVAVSIFFTLWHLTDDIELKSRNTKNDNEKFEEIDKRYISLLAAITKKDRNSEITIKENVRFVTWNYDLQLESAFAEFNHNASWDSISRNLKFRCEIGDTSNLQVCHLNGYHGFYYTEKNEIEFLTVPNSKNINKILESLDYIASSQRRKQLDISNHINYAWESNELAEKTRNEAKRIFSETDIIVIIGYSFPNFNKEIDKMLFDCLKGRKTTIYYQDPNASETFIAQLVNTQETEIICDRIRKDTFYLPYEF